MGFGGFGKRLKEESGYPYFCWLDKAGYFASAENQGAGLATLRFFDADTGDAKSDIPLNPLSLFPYDEAAYRSLGRDSYSLVLSESNQCVGSLLDEWSSIDFDEDSGVLRMMVYRPVGPLFEKRNQRVCKVQENWVEVRILPEDHFSHLLASQTTTPTANETAISASLNFQVTPLGYLQPRRSCLICKDNESYE